MSDTLVVVVGLLADSTPKDTGPDFGKASPFGLLVVVLLLIGTFLLVWSMNKRLKRLPQSFDNDDAEASVDEAAEPDTDTGTKAS
jgi:hypothetical protein